MLPVVNRASDHAPMVGVCCSACRVCYTSGAIGMIFAAGGAVAAFLVALGRRVIAKPS